MKSFTSRFSAPWSACIRFSFKIKSTPNNHALLIDQLDKNDGQQQDEFKVIMSSLSVVIKDRTVRDYVKIILSTSFLLFWSI